MPAPLSQWLTTFKDGLLQLLYPNSCCLCGILLNNQARVCTACERLLVTDCHDVCPRCAESVGPHAAREDGCVKCRQQKLAYDRAWRLGSYEGLLREAILRDGAFHTLALMSMLDREYSARQQQGAPMVTTDARL